MPNSKSPNINLSYYRLRKWIGLLGLLLPFLVPWISGEKLNSISHYYYTEAGVLFTSLLILIGVFLASYHGYDWVDNLITWLGGIFIILVAVIPTTYGLCCEAPEPTPICSCDSDRIWGFIHPEVIHFGSAMLFFIAMAIMSITQFTKGQKKAYNIFYIILGSAILVIMLYAGIKLKWFRDQTGDRFIYWVEVAMLIPFGAAWLLKGKALEDIADGLKYLKSKVSKGN